MDWGPWAERNVRTGPQVKREPTSAEDIEANGSPLAPSRPVYAELNTSHAILEWKSYSANFEFFMVEVRFVFLSAEINDGPSTMPPTSPTAVTAFHVNSFELFAYTNASTIVIDKEAAFGRRRPLPLVVFRVSAFNKVGISEPSPNSDLVRVRLGVKSTESTFNEKFQSTSELSFFYSNWWFLVIVGQIPN